MRCLRVLGMLLSSMLLSMLGVLLGMLLGNIHGRNWRAVVRLIRWLGLRRVGAEIHLFVPPSWNMLLILVLRTIPGVNRVSKLNLAWSWLHMRHFRQGQLGHPWRLFGIWSRFRHWQQENARLSNVDFGRTTLPDTA